MGEVIGVLGVTQARVCTLRTAPQLLVNDLEQVVPHPQLAFPIGTKNRSCSRSGCNLRPLETWEVSGISRGEESFYCSWI